MRDRKRVEAVRVEAVRGLGGALRHQEALVQTELRRLSRVWRARTASTPADTCGGGREHVASTRGVGTRCIGGAAPERREAPLPV